MPRPTLDQYVANVDVAARVAAEPAAIRAFRAWLGAQLDDAGVDLSDPGHRRLAYAVLGIASEGYVSWQREPNAGAVVIGALLSCVAVAHDLDTGGTDRG